MLTVLQLHQILAPIMSVLLTVPLGPHPAAPTNSGQPPAYDLRVKAAGILNKIATMYGPTYPGLIPREP